MTTHLSPMIYCLVACLTLPLSIWGVAYRLRLDLSYLSCVKDLVIAYGLNMAILAVVTGLLLWNEQLNNMVERFATWAHSFCAVDESDVKH